MQRFYHKQIIFDVFSCMSEMLTSSNRHPEGTDSLFSVYDFGKMLSKATFFQILRFRDIKEKGSFHLFVGLAA